jgi:uncharacterized protein (DUF2236 family)
MTITAPDATGSLTDKITRRLAAKAGLPQVDFTEPRGEAALVPHDSISWRVFKNPIALFVGGVTAVLLELGEPRVRTGVWDHTSFRTDPLPRMRRTGLAAMVTVYGPRSVAEKMIAGINRMHGRVTGQTPAGIAYRASDVELLDWVQVTASFGFLEAYCAFVKPLSKADRDQYYSESVKGAALYGATGAAHSVIAQQAQFATMLPKLERSDIVFEFLDIMRRTPVFPAPLRRFQAMLIRAGVDILPADVREVLGLDAQFTLKPWERRLIGFVARLSDRIRIPNSPQIQACTRLGLPANYLYR